MLTIGGGARSRFCDGVTRRDFLKIGGLALGGLSLPRMLRAEAKAGVGSSNKSVIMVFLAGGRPHLDMVELKAGAPAEIRGGLRPTPRRVGGREGCVHVALQ